MTQHDLNQTTPIHPEPDELELQEQFNEMQRRDEEDANNDWEIWA